MFQTLKNFHGQGFMVQYAMTFAIVLAVVLAMMTYFKRVVQSRIAGLRDYAGDEIDAVLNDNTLNLIGNFKRQYEPYYQQTQAEKTFTGTVIDREQGGIGPGSIHSKEYQDYRTQAKMLTNQLSPKDAD